MMHRALRHVVRLASLLSAQEPPAKTHPVPEDPRWLTYAGSTDADAPGSRQARRLRRRRARVPQPNSRCPCSRVCSPPAAGWHCTVLFAQHEGKVDPTQKTVLEDQKVVHDIPGLEHLASADLLVVFTRFITLPDEQLAHLNDYLDSGKPMIGIRTANHGFRGNWTYRVAGKRVDFGVDVLGGTFLGHHGGWHREATRGIVVEANHEHPILQGVEDVFGPSDVYRTYPEGGRLPPGCTPLLLGQPLQSLAPDAEPNAEKEALPVAWTKTWTGNGDRSARVFHVTMGSARDFQSAGLRRLFLNAALWCVGREERIRADLDVDLVGAYAPLESGFDHERLGVKPRPPADYR
jgi:type 1 glutamine amidotransferase